MKEQWRSIKGYEDCYKVSNFGRVKSLSRLVGLGTKSERITNERILSEGLSSGYYTVSLFNRKKRRTYQVHQLVAIAFLNHTPNGNKLVVDHIDNNPLNNRLDNLQVITQRENLSKDRVNKISRYTGVKKNKKGWVARIWLKGEQIYLGYFKCELAAAVAYQKALKDL